MGMMRPQSADALAFITMPEPSASHAPPARLNSPHGRGVSVHLQQLAEHGACGTCSKDVGPSSPHLCL